jgi:hypothetical protein
MHKYLDYINEQIRFHGTELEKLINAREVVLRIDDAQKKPVPQGRRVHRAKPTPREGDTPSIRQRILEHLRGMTVPVATAMVMIKIMYPDGATKREKHGVHNAMSYLKSQGILTKDGLTYTLVADKKDIAA